MQNGSNRRMVGCWWSGFVRSLVRSLVRCVLVDGFDHRNCSRVNLANVVADEHSDLGLSLCEGIVSCGLFDAFLDSTDVFCVALI